MEMNESKVQKLINQEIAEQQKRQATRKQYPVAKSQLAKLEELGILNLMPTKFGYTDAAVVIAAATTGKTAIFNAMGEGEEIPAQPLFTAVNEDTDEEITDERDYSDNLIDEVAALENARQVKADSEYADAHTDWSY
jgi:hypothetical protein